MNKIIQDANPLIEQINSTEKKRNDAYVKLRNHFNYKEDASFYHLVVNFPEDERDLFAELFRSLKLAAFKIQGVTGGIDSYVSNVSDSMHQILNELFPARKGKLYSKAGSPKEAEMNPMVLNHQL